jgi:hypothetical protein
VSVHGEHDNIADVPPTFDLRLACASLAILQRPKYSAQLLFLGFDNVVRIVTLRGSSDNVNYLHQGSINLSSQFSVTTQMTYLAASDMVLVGGARSATGGVPDSSSITPLAALRFVDSAPYLAIVDLRQEPIHNDEFDRTTSLPSFPLVMSLSPSQTMQVILD